ncbi:hypothetical protein ABZ951_00705 [Streptomyces sp. NPDC046215]|uniref:Uncharacterized protein n=1 Tax=Streptomyces stramineus TaxID=173861 RepID=A0ABN0ZNQ1_9ACTN
MHDTVAPASWPCVLCDRPARTRVHDDCRVRVATNLDELPVLYRRLEEVLVPGRAGGDGRTGSRTAPLPVNLSALDLRARGGIEGVLTSWEQDARDLLGLPGVPCRGAVEQQVGGAAAFLQDQLLWFCDIHPAVREFADEIRNVAAQARYLITGETPERHVRLACPCGATLSITLATPGRQCTRCGQQYSWQDLRDLPIAERHAA